MRIIAVVCMTLFFSHGHAQFNPIPTFAVGQINNQTAFEKSEKQWVYQVGCRGRYLFPTVYFGGDIGIGFFNEEVTSSAWLDIGLTRRFFRERLRINFGAGMAYSGFVLSKFPSSKSLSKEYDHNFSPFIACDYEFWKLLLRVQYQPHSEYESRIAIGMLVF